MLQELRCRKHLASNGDYLGDILHNINDLHLFIECKTILAVITPLHSLAHLNDSFVGSDTAEQHLYECGLSGTVIAHNTQFLVPRKGVEKVLCNNLVAESL